MFPGMRDYPKFLKVRGEDWEIKFFKSRVDDWDKEKEKEELEDTLGLCDATNKIIYIKMGQSREDIFKTFVHELLHAVEEEYCITIPHRIVYKMEDVARDLLAQNRDFAASLFFFLFSPER